MLLAANHQINAYWDSGIVCNLSRSLYVNVPPHKYSVITTNEANASVIYSQNKYHVSHDACNEEALFDVLFIINVKRGWKGNRQKEETQKQDSGRFPVYAQHNVVIQYYFIS